MATYDEIKKIVIGKLVDKTIDKDYEELSESLFGDGNCYSASETRKRMYGMKTIIEAIENDAESKLSADTIEELEKKKIDLQKERQRFFDQRREYNKLISDGSRTEHLYDVLTNAAMRLDEKVGRLDFEKCFYPDDIYSGNEAVLVFSDWHYGMKTDNAFNKFDTEICKRRVHDVVGLATKKIALHGCDCLHIVILGDLFHGAIHTSARVASEELVCEQIMEVSEILAQSINELSRYVHNTYVYMTYGNHGRTVQNKNDSIHRDNLERIIPWWLEQRLKENESVFVTEDTGTEFVFVNAAGHDFCASHGDIDSVRSSPRLLPTLLNKQYGKNIEYILLGDKHHSESFEELGVTAILCGALCGSDDYANGKRLYSTPSQLLLIVNPEDGVDAEYRIKI